MTDLNEQQKRAASFKNGICAVIAVPGAGKTTVMTQRIGILVKKYGIPPENILGLTFTRNAADAMRLKLSPVLDELASRVMLSTIHSFCFWLLKSEGVVFEIVSGKDQLVMIRKTMKDAGIKDLSTGMVLSEISLAKNNLISVQEFKDLYDGDRTMQKIAEVYEAYDAEKKKKMLMDFDDLLVETHLLLSENLEVREKYRSIFRHLLIDEFQDTNPAAMELLKLLMDGSTNGACFWVCGDDYQAIYAFTGASVANILNFKKTFPKSQEFILSVNYRSTPQIISACQNLISHNVRRIEKSMETKNRSGDEITVLECISEEDEAKQIAEEISDLTSKGYEHKDIAILYRANFQSRVVEEVFLQQKIPYRIENGMSFYQRREVKILLDYLRLIHAPESEEGNESLKDVINFPNRYIGRKFIGELERFAEKNGLHLYPALRSMPIELPYIRKNVKDLINFLDPLIGQQIEPGELILILRNSLDYDRELTTPLAPRIYLAIRWLSIYVAFRPGELLRIREKDIDFKNGRIVLQDHKTARKTKEPKVVPLLEEDIAFLRELPRAFDPDTPFFRHDFAYNSNLKAGKPFGQKILYRYWKRACEALKIKDVDLYGGTRHTSARFYRQYMSAEDVQRLTMHSTSKAGLRYLQVRDDELLRGYALADKGTQGHGRDTDGQRVLPLKPPK
jgi:DNA helicase II / ATP-dependent DNA helicase PcrA